MVTNKWFLKSKTLLIFGYYLKNIFLLNMFLRFLKLILISTPNTSSK